MAHLFFEEIVDSVSDALITVDQNKRIIIWNSMAKDMFGYDKAEIQEMGLDAIIPPAYRQRHCEGYDRFIHTIDAHDSYVSDIRQFEALRKSGELFPVELTHSLLKVSNQEFYITATVRDISLRKRYEIMRDRVDRITRHDLKNKLVIISLAAKRLTATPGRDREAQLAKYAEIIQSESKSAIEVLNSTRELILLETGEYVRKNEIVDLPALLSLKAEHLQPMAAAKGVTISFHNRTTREMTLQADRSMLERALENLLKNAIEAEDPSKTVELILEEDEKGAPVLEIHNGGKAIPEEIQRLIFTPYVTHGKKEGIGLGLYSARLILEMIHGWQISFRSGSQGTTFRVIFRSPNN